MKKKQKIEVRARQTEIKGVYSNVMQLKRSKEEFCLDFLNLFPPMGALTARVIISPGHLKRMVRVLSNGLEKYEKEFGEIKEAKEPKESQKIGFASK